MSCRAGSMMGLAISILGGKVKFSVFLMSGLPTFPLTDGRVLRRVVCVWKVTRECVLDRSSCVLVRLGRKRTREHRSVRRLPLLIIIDFGAKDWTLLRNH